MAAPVAGIGGRRPPCAVACSGIARSNRLGFAGAQPQVLCCALNNLPREARAYLPVSTYACDRWWALALSALCAERCVATARPSHFATQRLARAAATRRPLFLWVCALAPAQNLGRSSTHFTGACGRADGLCRQACVLRALLFASTARRISTRKNAETG